MMSTTAAPNSRRYLAASEIRSRRIPRTRVRATRGSPTRAGAGEYRDYTAVPDPGGGFAIRPCGRSAGLLGQVIDFGDDDDHQMLLNAKRSAPSGADLVDECANRFDDDVGKNEKPFHEPSPCTRVALAGLLIEVIDFSNHDDHAILLANWTCRLFARATNDAGAPAS